MPKQKNKISNTDILTAGAKAYAKKRQKKQQTIEVIEFDPKARREFLTGFRKRKLERKKKAEEYRKEQERKDRLELRAAVRAEQKRQIEQRLAEAKALMSGGEEEEEEEQEDKKSAEEVKKAPSVQIYESKKAITTVTVIEDFDPKSL